MLGEVAKPDTLDLPIESRLTVLEAVSLAGGCAPIAAPDRTRVIRTKDGRNETIEVPVSDITKCGLKEKDIPLEPNDVVYVPQSFF